MKILVLDDNEERQKVFSRGLIGHVVKHAYSFDEFVYFLHEGSPFDEIYLDHDLSVEATLGAPSMDEKTGQDAVKEIIELSVDRHPKRVIVHTLNSSGVAEKMCDALHKAGISVDRITFLQIYKALGD